MAGTNNGRSPQLAGYYAFWEQAVFNALAVMLMHSLDRLHTMFGPAAKQPLFRVSFLRRLHCSPALSSTCLCTQGEPRHGHCNANSIWHLKLSLQHSCPWDSMARQLKTSLQNAEVVVQPPVKETTKLLTSYIKNVVESCRWVLAS